MPPTKTKKKQPRREMLREHKDPNRITLTKTRRAIIRSPRSAMVAGEFFSAITTLASPLKCGFATDWFRAAAALDAGARDAQPGVEMKLKRAIKNLQNAYLSLTGDELTTDHSVTSEDSVA